MPIRDHYFEPQFDFRNPKVDFRADRSLPAINWNTSVQLAWLDRLQFASELSDLPHRKPAGLGFYFNNGSFESGDAEYWYQLLRALKPKRVFEIGSGNSTLMAIEALTRNAEDHPEHTCELVCIEPYEKPWLESLSVRVIREKVEELPLEFFRQLQENDILFIDSSHVIRPQGDVLFEFLQILPSLNRGVIVHIHDIFSPKDYLAQWLIEDIRLWNEQYLLEAFLSNNDSWEVIGALNYLHHHYYDQLARVAPYLVPEREPGSFYLRKIAQTDLSLPQGP